MPSKIRRLPPELINAILRHLRVPKDLKSLESCCLVCRSWHAMARRYLFTTLCIQDKGQTWTGWKEWHDFLVQRHPDFSLVSCLRVEGPTQGVQLTIEQLSPVFSSLPRLRHVFIAGWGIYYFRSSNAHPFNISLEELRIGDVYPASNPQDVVDVFRCFSSTRAFDIHCSIYIPGYTQDVDEDGFTEQLILPTESAPEFLAIRGTDKSAAFFLDVFRGTRAPATLLTLKIAFNDIIVVFPSLVRFLQALRCLQELIIDVGDRYYTEEQASTEARNGLERQLGPVLTKMRTLTTFSFTPFDVPQGHAYWEFCFAFLRVLPSSLERVDLIVSEESRFFPMQRIEACLTNYAGLKKLRVVVDEEMAQSWQDGVVEEYSRQIREGMPTLAARGALELIFRSYFE